MNQRNILTKERFYIFEATYALQEKEREDNPPPTFQ